MFSAFGMGHIGADKIFAITELHSIRRYFFFGFLSVLFSLHFMLIPCWAMSTK